MGSVANVLAFAVSLVLAVVGLRTAIIYTQAYAEMSLEMAGEGMDAILFGMFIPGMAGGYGVFAVGAVIMAILVRRWRSP